MQNDVGYGSATAPLPDWRLVLANEPDDDDDEDKPTPPDVIAVLGFDPQKGNYIQSYTVGKPTKTADGGVVTVDG
jgi:hypothetical protein